MQPIDTTSVERITLYDAIDLILRTGGKFFRVDFLKRNKRELRPMVARLGVRTSGPPARNWSPSEKALIQVWDAAQRDYRMIPVEGIKALRVAGQTYGIR